MLNYFHHVLQKHTRAYAHTHLYTHQKKNTQPCKTRLGGSPTSHHPRYLFFHVSMSIPPSPPGKSFSQTSTDSVLHLLICFPLFFFPSKQTEKFAAYGMLITRFLRRPQILFSTDGKQTPADMCNGEAVEPTRSTIWILMILRSETWRRLCIFLENRFFFPELYFHFASTYEFPNQIPLKPFKIMTVG